MSFSHASDNLELLSKSCVTVSRILWNRVDTVSMKYFVLLWNVDELCILIFNLQKIIIFPRLHIVQI